MTYVTPKDATQTTMCPSCFGGPCHDGTMCDGSRKDDWTWIQVAMPYPSFEPLRKLHVDWRGPRYQNQAPRSPKPGFRKGR